MRYIIAQIIGYGTLLYRHSPLYHNNLENSSIQRTRTVNLGQNTLWWVGLEAQYTLRYIEPYFALACVGEGLTVLLPCLLYT